MNDPVKASLFALITLFALLFGVMLLYIPSENSAPAPRAPSLPAPKPLPRPDEPIDPILPPPNIPPHGPFGKLPRGVILNLVSVNDDSAEIRWKDDRGDDRCLILPRAEYDQQNKALRAQEDKHE